MAKSGFWLRGAKGKLAGAALQKGANGETIMREIVTPTNPKTEAQMIQRIIMHTVMGETGTCHLFHLEKIENPVREIYYLNWKPKINLSRLICLKNIKN